MIELREVEAAYTQKLELVLLQKPSVDGRRRTCVEYRCHCNYGQSWMRIVNN